jgi:alkylated DNA repair dioxygenase AlkB
LTAQLALFEAPSRAPQGLSYRQEFISARLEQELVARVAELPLKPFQFGAFEGKRRVASFGFRYDYSLQRLREAEPIPPWLRDVIAEVEAFGGAPTRIGQVLCTEYAEGVGIGWHRDKPHYDRVFGLSLGSVCKFRFRRKTAGGWERLTLEAAPRSIYLMDGPARQEWEHSIPPVDAPRTSITFRTMAERH